MRCRKVEAVGATLAFEIHTVNQTDSLNTLAFGALGAILPVFVGCALLGLGTRRREPSAPRRT